MAVQSREHFTYLEVYRPVESGLEQFLDKVRFHGEEAFGTKINTVLTQPVLEEGPDGGEEPVMQTRGVEVPRLHVYSGNQLSMQLIDRRVEPRMNYGSRFRWVASRLIRKPDDFVYRPIPRSPEEEKARYEKKRRDSLAFIFEQIGLKYDIVDQDHLEVPLRALDIPVDPPLEHLGHEVALVPDPKSKVTRMLVEQAGVCLRGLSRHSPKAANPYSPTALRIPFARMPRDASEHEVDRFLGSVEEHLPQRVVLGAFKDHVGGSSWVVNR
jgi:hypothetical protein